MSRLATFWRSESLRKILVSLGTLIILVSLPTIVVLLIENNRSQDNHHAQTEKQDAVLARKDDEIKRLVNDLLFDHKGTQAEIEQLALLEKTIDQGAPAIELGQTQLLGHVAWIQCALSAGAASCGTPPPTS